MICFPSVENYEIRETFQVWKKLYDKICFFKHDKLYEILAQFYVNSSCDAVWRDNMYENKKVRMYASM